MKRFAIVVGSIIALALVALVALAIAPPKGLVKSWLVQQVETTTGRNLTINGEMSVRLLPRLVLRLENVTLSNPPGPSREPLFAARAVLIEGELWPLLTGRTVIDRLSLEEPRVALSTDPQGKPNWIIAQGGGRPVTVQVVAIGGGTLTYQDGTSGEMLHVAGIDGIAKDFTGGKVAEVALKSREATVRGAPGGPTVMFRSLDAAAKAVTADSLGEIVLKAAKLLYRESEGAAAVELDGPQAAAKSVARDAAIDAAIAFVWNKDLVSGGLRLPSPAALIEGKPAPLSARLTAPKAKLDLAGSFALTGGAARIDGKADAATSSLRSLATWVGVQLPTTGAFGTARATGDVKLEGKRIAFDNAQFVLDTTKAAGSLAVDLGGARPFVSGSLKADELDADSLLEAQTAVAPAKTARVRGLVPPPPPATPAVPVKEALKVYLRAQLVALDAPSPAAPEVSLQDLSAVKSRTRALAVDAEWNDDAFDLSGLKTVDADLSLSVGKLTVLGWELGVPELKAVLKDGALSLDAKNLAVEGGRITGTANIDVREAQPKLATKFKAEGVEAQALFEQVGQTALFAGKSALEADVRGSGNSLRKLVESLTGRVTAETKNGAIIGYDLSFASIVSWLFGERQYDASRRIPFERLTAEMALSKGVTSKSSLHVTGPVLGATADGMLQLPKRELDYRARVSWGTWGPYLLRIFGEWEALSLVPEGFDATRSLEAQANPLDLLKEVDLKDPELASLADAVLKKAAGTTALPPHAIQALEGLKARAEGR